MGKAPVFGRGFFDSYLSLPDGVNLSHNGDVVCFHWFELVSGLTNEFADVFANLFFKLLISIGLFDSTMNGVVSLLSHPAPTAPTGGQSQNTGILHVRLCSGS
jgi:hypothetical protein